MARSPSRFAEFTGSPIEVRYSGWLRDAAGQEAHAATFIRSRLIVLDSELTRNAQEHARILTHELFHFVWVRLSNARRFGWEELLRDERKTATRGEAGWSAEWRKQRLAEWEVVNRTRRWREYCCEAFCDTAALIHVGRDAERTLSLRALQVRRKWFECNVSDAPHI